MLMPKTAVYEQREAMFGKDKVWRARQIAAMQPKAIPERMRSTAGTLLWPCVLGTDPRHVGAALLGRMPVSHAEQTRGLAAMSMAIMVSAFFEVAVECDGPVSDQAWLHGSHAP